MQSLTTTEQNTRSILSALKRLGCRAGEGRRTVFIAVYGGVSLQPQDFADAIILGLDRGWLTWKGVAVYLTETGALLA